MREFESIGFAHRQLPDSLLVPSFLCVVVSVAMERELTSATKQTRKLYRGTKIGSSRTEISDAIAGHKRSLRVGVAARLSGVGAA